MCLAQLAVKPGFQRRGIGTRLIALAVQRMGDEVSLVTHAADAAIGFYKAEKFDLRTNVFRIERKK
jgi:ribosomal protein S18 acetylase RimI-like enzyme